MAENTKIHFDRYENKEKTKKYQRQINKTINNTNNQIGDRG